MITTLLWDLDNTLLDFPSAERQALITTFADFTLGPCSPDLLVRYSALNARWWRRLEEGDVTKAELLPGRFREFFAAEGIACTEYDAFNAAYQHHLGDTIVFLDNGYELVLAVFVFVGFGGGVVLLGADDEGHGVCPCTPPVGEAPLVDVAVDGADVLVEGADLICVQLGDLLPVWNALVAQMIELGGTSRTDLGA